jgi:hypothetical protein
VSPERPVWAIGSVNSLEQDVSDGVHGMPLVCLSRASVLGQQSVHPCAAKDRGNRRIISVAMPRRTPGLHRLAVLVAVLGVVAGTQALFAAGAGAAGFVPIMGST